MLKCLNRHISKSIWVTSLFFCQSGSLMGGWHWQKDRLVTYILFDLCLFQHFSPVANFGWSSVSNNTESNIHFDRNISRIQNLVIGHVFCWVSLRLDIGKALRYVSWSEKVKKVRSWHPSWWSLLEASLLTSSASSSISSTLILSLSVLQVNLFQKYLFLH